MIEIRKLTLDDIEAWKAIRFELLQLHPEAFGESLEEARTKSDEQYKAGLLDGAVFGAFTQNELIGVAGFYVNKFNKTKHRGNLYSVYVKQEFRGKGIANKLIEAVLDYAATCVMQVHCTVVTTNATAKKLYERLGFQAYGTEPRSLRIGDQFFDELLMVKKIK